MKNGTNNDYAYTTDLPTRPRTIQSGNAGANKRYERLTQQSFTVNGNQQRNSTTGNRLGSNVAWYCGINLMDLDHITIENVVVVNTPASSPFGWPKLF